MKADCLGSGWVLRDGEEPLCPACGQRVEVEVERERLSPSARVRHVAGLSAYRLEVDQEESDRRALRRVRPTGIVLDTRRLVRHSGAGR